RAMATAPASRAAATSRLRVTGPPCRSVWRRGGTTGDRHGQQGEADEGCQALRILFFSAWNSASVRTPWALSSPSCLSCSSLSEVSSAGAAAACGGGAYACCCCCCSYCCCCSCSDQRPACRRETRLETAVAVPATTAVRPTARMRPGITVLFPSPPCGLLDLSLPLVLFSGVERGENCLHRDPTAGNELGATAPQCRRKRRGPGVLVD